MTSNAQHIMSMMAEFCYSKWHYANSFILSVVVLNVAHNSFLLSVVMLNVIMLSVLAPFFHPFMWENKSVN